MGVSFSAGPFVQVQAAARRRVPSVPKLSSLLTTTHKGKWEPGSQSCNNDIFFVLWVLAVIPSCALSRLLWCRNRALGCRGLVKSVNVSDTRQSLQISPCWDFFFPKEQRRDCSLETNGVKGTWCTLELDLQTKESCIALEHLAFLPWQSKHRTLQGPIVYKLLWSEDPLENSFTYEPATYCLTPVSSWKPKCWDRLLKTWCSTCLTEQHCLNSGATCCNGMFVCSPRAPEGCS